MTSVVLCLGFPVGERLRVTFNIFILTDKYSSVYGGGGQTYVYHHEEDESSFRLVDTARVQKQPHHNKRIKYSQVSDVAACVAEVEVRLHGIWLMKCHAAKDPSRS